MNNQNSYYLYQQYEKRGSQDWLPCYPNIYSVDGDGTMPLVLRKENDPQCGYVPPVEPIYRWYNLPIETDYICDECPPVHDYRWVNMPITTDWECVGTDQYYKQKKQYTLNGTDWYDVEPLQTQRGSLYQSQSVTCGYVPPIEPQYRTISGTPYCQSVDKYVDVYSQVSYDGGSTWTTTATTPTLVERNSQECGYIEPQYRWETAPQSDYMCSGSSKYYKEYYEVSYDNGLTWKHVEPEQTRRGSLIEEYSQDCGYYLKYLGTYSNGTTRRLECESGGNHMLTRGEVQPSNTLVSAEVGDCICVIDMYCFGDSTSLTSVTLTDKLTGINQSAFSGCTSLTGITIPSGVTLIAQYAFQGCTSLTGITIPKSVESIPNTAFSGCTGMTSLVFEEGSRLTALTNYSFAGCKSLTGVTIPSGITTMGVAFNDCTSLSSVTFENNSQLTTINGFGGCTSLTGITIPSSVTTIKNSAFSLCTSLTSIDIPASVTNIDNYAFELCSGLTGVTVNAITPPTLGTGVFDYTSNCPIYVPCDSLELYRSSWSNYSNRIVCEYVPPQYRTTSGTPYCTGDDKYVDVYSQISYDGGSTWNTTAITSTLLEVHSEDCVKIVTTYAGGSTGYVPCDGNTTLTTGNTRNAGGEYSAMTNAHIGYCVTIIGNSAFSGCSSLTSVTIPSSVTSIGDTAFNRCVSLTGIDLPSGVISIGSEAFSNCSGLTGNLIIPSGVTNIGYYTFSGCRSLTGITIPSGVTGIGSGAFSRCDSLASVTIPNSVTSIGEYAFVRCGSITSLTIGNGVTIIGEYAFGYCSGLTTVNIPDSVRSISQYAFSSCSGLTSITVEATTPPTLGTGVFNRTNDCPIYVPSESVSEYRSSWSNYASRIQAIP